MPSSDLDPRVKLAIYEITAKSGRVPNSSKVSRKIDVDESEVLGAFARLHTKRLILPEPGHRTRIQMAPPLRSD
jgi:Mn-dependent DtxR family transcriptional regulator